MLLDNKTYLIKEHVEFMKLSGTYDIISPETGTKIGIAIEEPGIIVKLLRLVANKKMLPNHVNIYDNQTNEIAFYIKKPANLFRSKIMIYDKNHTFIGYFKSKLLTIGGGFFVHDTNDQVVAEIKGDWKGWNFKFLNNQDQEIGTVTKKWAGIGKELFTSADNYIISIHDTGNHDEIMGILLLAAGLAIDTIFKEKK